MLRRRFCQLAAVSTSTLLTSPWLSAEQASTNSDVPWLPEVQRPPQPVPAEIPPLKSVLVDGEGRRIATREGWEQRRQELQGEWRQRLGSLNLDERRRPELEVVAEDRDAGVLRQLVRYESEPGIPTEAYLIRPLAPAGKCPGIAVFHSTVNHSILQPAGLGPDTQKAFGLKFAQQGAVTVSPRNFLWPDNQHIAANEEAARFHARHPRATGMAKMLYDAQLALNVLESLPEVDASRLGAVGHSLGAKEVLYLAAFDARVKATVSSEGGIGTRFSNWDAPWYLGPMIKQPEFAREHHELLALAAPHPFLLIGGDSADGDRSWPYIEAALPVYRLYSDTPRLGLFNHRLGHAVPPEAEQRIYEWLGTYLKN